MSIRPVDLQVVMQKTTEVSKNHNTENSRPELLQHTISEKSVKEAELNERRVIRTEQTDKQMVDKDGKQGSGREQKKKRNRDDDTKDKIETPRVDFSV